MKKAPIKELLMSYDLYVELFLSWNRSLYRTYFGTGTAVGA
jgi:hypothetical protein